jgi:integrase
MPATVVEALRSHRVRQLEERLFAGDEWEDWGLVVATAKGTPLDQSRVSKHFKRMLRNAGLPDIRFHDLRHSCASLLLAQHVPARVVMEILGHSNISLTMNTYSHVLPALEQEAADLMDDVLRRAN